MESFNGDIRGKLLNGEIFYTLAEAKIAIERWRRYYNAVRYHAALDYKPPSPEAVAWPGSPVSLLGTRPAGRALAEKPTLN